MRPRGVTILAILWTIGGIIEIVSGVAMSSVLPFLPKAGEMDKAMGGYFTAMYVVFGVIGLVVAYGLWTLKNWARILAIVLCILGILGGFGGIYSLYAMQKIGMVQSAATIVECVMGAIIVVLALMILYLIRVREAFA